MLSNEMHSLDGSTTVVRRGQASLFTAGHFNFLTLLITTPVSIFLLYLTLESVRYPGGFFDFVSNNRPSVQFAIQIIANFLSAAQVIVVCRLINFAIRRHFAKHNMELNSMLMWTDAMITHVDWDLPPRFLVLLLLFLGATKALRGIWAAALTPVITWKETDGEVLIPSWDNMTLIREYPSQVFAGIPPVQNPKGRFSYSVGLEILGSLLGSASSATPTDGGVRQHRKIDNSRYTYTGRSYGMGSSAGIIDGPIEGNRHAKSYSYQEIGYRADARCIFNDTSEFVIEPTNDRWVYALRGRLPDSDDSEEYSNYIGYDDSKIVSIGVAHFAEATDPVLPLRRYLAFATGEFYAFLDKVQCEVDFLPSKFNVTVNIEGRNITVQPTDDVNVRDIDPSRRLKGTLLRQFELIANDETNLYVSMVGAAFNASITDMKTYAATQSNLKEVQESDLILQAVRNSVVAMTDDMLGAYAAAQIVVSSFTQTTPAIIRVSAIAIGEFKFAMSIFALNVAVIAAFIIEVIRTKWWKGMPDFDMADLRHVAVAASAGGMRLGRRARGKKVNEIGRMEIKYGECQDGEYYIMAGDVKEEERTPILMQTAEFDRVKDNRPVAGTWL